MQRFEVSGAVRPLQGSLGVKGLNIKIRSFRFNNYCLMEIFMSVQICFVITVFNDFS